ncbi:MAG TPA: HEAT repeat domain-containing protein, partial [Humisphaera sp.]
LTRLAAARDFRARAYAARVAGHWFDRLDKPLDLLARLAADDHPRVRVEAIVSASFVPDARAIEVAAIAADRPVDPWVEHAMLRAVDAQKDRWRPAFLKGELAFDKKINRLSWVLRCDGSPETAGAVRQMLEGQKVAADDESGLAVLLANVGTADDLRFLFDRFGTDPAVLTELATVARSRNLQPTGELADQVMRLLGHPKPGVRAAAARAAGAWGVWRAALALQITAYDKAADVPVRVAAVEALGDVRAATAERLAPLMAADQPAEVRVAAVAALAASDRPAAAAAAAKLLASLEKDEQVAGLLAGFLSRQGGPEELAKAIGAAGLPPKAAQRALDAMHARGRGDPPLVDALNKAMGVSADTPPYSEALVQSLVADSAKLGDAARGKALYQQKLTACAACHAISGQGGDLGPDLTGIGRGMTPELIVEAVLWPKRQVKEGYLSVSVVTKAGDDFTGYAESEDAAELRLKDVATGKVQRIPKPQIAKRTNAGTIMPDGLTATLKREELLDLLAFLRSLGR